MTGITQRPDGGVGNVLHDAVSRDELDFDAGDILT
jgi:hypothetical protein